MTYYGSRAGLDDIFPIPNTVDETGYISYNWSLVSGIWGLNDNKTLTMSVGDTYVFALETNRLYSPDTIEDIVKAYILIPMSGAASFDVFYDWNIGWNEGYSYYPDSNNWSYKMPANRAITPLGHISVYGSKIKNYWVKVPDPQGFHRRMYYENNNGSDGSYKDGLLIRLTCTSGTAELDWVAYQEESVDGAFLVENYYEWENDWHPEYIVNRVISGGYGARNGWVSKSINETTLGAPGVDNANFEQAMIPYRYSKWQTMMAAADLKTNLDYGNAGWGDQHVSVGDSAAWSWHTFMWIGWTDWSVSTTLPIVERGGIIFEMPINRGGGFWSKPVEWASPDLSAYPTGWVEGAIAGYQVENKAAEILYETGVAHCYPAGFSPAGAGKGGSWRLLNHKAIDPGGVLAFALQSNNTGYWPGTLGFRHSEMGESVAPLTAESFSLDGRWLIKTVPEGTQVLYYVWQYIQNAWVYTPIYGVRPSYKIGQVFLSAAFDLDMSLTPPPPDTSTNSNEDWYSGTMPYSNSGSRMGWIGIESVTADVKYPRWKAQILKYRLTKLPSPGGNIPPLRQRHRDDGLTTDTRQEKGNGSSLQSSLRRGGRVYH